MGLWGKSTSADSRPKFLKGDGAEGAGGKKEDCSPIADNRYDLYSLRLIETLALVHS